VIGSLEGARSVDTLVYALSDEDPGVKLQACKSLGQLGRAARKAIPHMQALVQIDMPTFFDSDEEAKAWLLLSDAQSACRESLGQIER
jgi:hypothetical protein